MSELKARVLDEKLTPFERLVVLLEILRSPEGCAWDRKQTHQSLLPYLIEETFEVVETIEENRTDELAEELGDVLCQVVFHAQLAKERGDFTVDDACTKIVDKLLRRHPHVFGEKQELDPNQVREQWEKNKTRSGEKKSVLSGLPKSMPALAMAFRMGEKAGGVGFDWHDSKDVLAKIKEELGEVEDEINRVAPDREKISGEIGDLLFAVASFARKLNIDPESSLRRALEKFRDRFDAMEAQVTQQGKHLDQYTLDELEAIWQEIKRNQAP